MRRMLVALLLILVSSATTDYAKTRETQEPLGGSQQGAITATSEPQALIFIFMKSSLTTQAAAPNVAVDDNVFCPMVGGTYCEVRVGSGKHKVTATLFEKRRTSVDLDVLAGETYYLEVAPKFSHLELSAVPKEKALPTVAKAKAIYPVGFEEAQIYTPAYWREEFKRRKALADEPAADPICKPKSFMSGSHKCQAYPGDNRPKRDVAIVKLSNVDAELLDGKRLVICNMPRDGQLRNKDCDGAVESIELLPGKYEIAFSASRPYTATSFSSTGIQVLDLTAEAGKTYKFVGIYNIACAGGPLGPKQCAGTWSVELK